jgi:hypothetical protein
VLLQTRNCCRRMSCGHTIHEDCLH